MADAKRKLMIEILSNASGAQKGFKDAEGAAGSLGKSLGKAAGLAGAFVGVAGAADLVKDSIGAAMSDEKSQEGLAQQIKSLGGLTSAIDGSKLGFKESTKTIEDYVSKLSLAQGVADDELRPAMAQILRSTQDVGIAQEDMGLAMDIAAAKGISVAEAADLMAKAQNGNTKGLKSLGISLKDANGKALGLDEIFGKLHKTFDGAGEAAAQTGSGKMRKMAVAFDEMKEKIGYALMPVIEKLVDWVTTKLIPAIEKLGQWIKIHVLPPLKVLADFIGQKVVPALHAIFDFLMDHKEILIGIGVAILASLVPAFVAWATTAGAAAVATIAAAAPVIALGVVIAALVTGVVIAVKAIIDHWTEIVDFFEALPGKILDFLKDLPDKMLAAGKAILGGLLDGIKWLATTGLYEYFIGLPLLIGGWILDAGLWLFEKGKSLLGGLLGGIKDIALTAMYQWFVGLPLLIVGWMADAGGWLLGLGKKVAGGFVTGLGDLVSGVVTFFRNFPGLIGGAASDAFKFLKDAFKGAINWIIKGWNAIEFKLPSIDWGPVHLGGYTIGLPDIPYLAAGGIVTRPTLAMLGEGGREAVIPLDRMGGVGSTYNFTVNGFIGSEKQLMDHIAMLLRDRDRGLR